MEEFNEQMCHEEFHVIEKLILLQLQRIDKAETLDEAKAINEKLIEALK